MKAKVLSIDAWRNDGGWTWNAWYEHKLLTDKPHLSSEVELPDRVTPRQLLRLAREWGLLSDQSKGRVTVEDDGYNFVIEARGTGEPLYAFEYGSYTE